MKNECFAKYETKQLHKRPINAPSNTIDDSKAKNDRQKTTQIERKTQINRVQIDN